ncbi:MAG: AraC family transcriptional regulator [Clostridia bacterium]|nr:AraC family transcriptional regulator [Clostridia bacterium]
MLKGYKIQTVIGIDAIHTFFRQKFCKGYVFNGESHNFWEMVFVLDGSVGITADSDVYVLEKGQGVIHRPNEFHKIWSEFDTDPTVIIVSFSANAFPDFDGRIVSLDTSQIKKIEHLYTYSDICFERDGSSIINIKPDTAYEMNLLKLELELLILSVLKKKTDTVSSGLKSAEIYSAAVKIMEENIGSGLGIDEIAKRCSISPAYLKKIFAKYSGSGVIQYYNRLKARIACVHLDNGKSVKETALLLGFADQNYFSTFFKRVMGVSPTSFRNKK